MNRMVFLLDPESGSRAARPEEKYDSSARRTGTHEIDIAARRFLTTDCVVSFYRDAICTFGILAPKGQPDRIARIRRRVDGIVHTRRHSVSARGPEDASGSETQEIICAALTFVASFVRSQQRWWSAHRSRVAAVPTSRPRRRSRRRGALRQRSLWAPVRLRCLAAAAPR